MTEVIQPDLPSAQIFDFIEPYVRREIEFALEDAAVDFADTVVSIATTRKIVSFLRKSLSHLKTKIGSIKFQNTSDSVFVIVKLKSGVDVGMKLSLYEELEGGFDFLISKVQVV